MRIFAKTVFLVFTRHSLSLSLTHIHTHVIRINTRTPINAFTPSPSHFSLFFRRGFSFSRSAKIFPEAESRPEAKKRNRGARNSLSVSLIKRKKGKKENVLSTLHCSRAATLFIQKRSRLTRTISPVNDAIINIELRTMPVPKCW